MGIGESSTFFLFFSGLKEHRQFETDYKCKSEAFQQGSVAERSKALV